MGKPAKALQLVREQRAEPLIWLAAIVVLLSGCAVSPAQQVGAWLREEPRKIAVIYSERYSQAHVFEHESQALKGAGEGALKGAVTPVAVGAQLREYAGFGIVFGIFVAPATALIGAVHGATTTEPILHRKELTDVKGAIGLFRAAGGPREMANRLHQMVIELGRDRIRHDLRSGAVVKAGPPAATTSTDLIPRWADASLNLVVLEYGLLGKSVDDPKFSFYAKIEAQIISEFPELPSSHVLHELEFATSKRTIADWTADDARQLKIAIGQAIDEFAKRVTRRLAHLESDE